MDISTIWIIYYQDNLSLKAFFLIVFKAFPHLTYKLQKKHFSSSESATSMLQACRE